MYMSLMGDYSAVYGIEDIRSCAPLSNRELIGLLRFFPGMKLSGDWFIQVTNPAAAQPLLNLLNVKYLLAPPDVSLEGAVGFPPQRPQRFWGVGKPAGVAAGLFL